MNHGCGTIKRQLFIVTLSLFIELKECHLVKAFFELLHRFALSWYPIVPRGNHQNWDFVNRPLKR